MLPDVPGGPERFLLGQQLGTVSSSVLALYPLLRVAPKEDELTLPVRQTLLLPTASLTQSNGMTMRNRTFS